MGQGDITYTFGPFRLEVAERLLFREGRQIPLGAKAFDLLLLLIESAGHLRTREELIEALWPTTVVGEHNLTVNLSAVRKALGEETGTRHYIQTVPRHGYRFIAPVAISNTQSAESASSPAGKVTSRRRFRATGSAMLIMMLPVAAGVLSWYLEGAYQENGHGRPIPTVAVLPIENLTDDPSNAYLARGIQDTIYTRLAGIPELRVLPRSMTDQYTSHPKNLKILERRLEVTVVVEGSVQRSGNRVLINLVLINAHDGDHIWAGIYSRSLDRFLETQGEISNQVARALQTKLLPAKEVRLINQGSGDNVRTQDQVPVVQAGRLLRQAPSPAI